MQYLNWLDDEMAKAEKEYNSTHSAAIYARLQTLSEARKRFIAMDTSF
jgi:hypothetical protein